MRKIKAFLGVIAVALLIVLPAMLLAPLWFALLALFVIIPLFVIACILMDKLEKNKEATNRLNDRFWDVIIGIITGLVASSLMWVLVTFDKIDVLTFLVWAVFILLVVSFSLAVIWEFIHTQRIR